MAKTRQNMTTVRVVAQERLDKPDFDAQGGLVDDHIQQTIGTLMGRGGGAFSPVTYTTSTDGVNYWISFDPFSYYWSQRESEQKATGQPVPYRGWRGGIARFVPTAPGQSAKWDYTAAQAAGNPGFIWARPATVNTDTDARRKWAGGVEQSASVQTRTSVITQFQFNNLDPNHANNDGWAPILYIPAWAAHLPDGATAVSVWDSWSAYAVAGNVGNFATDPALGVGLLLKQMAVGAVAGGLNAFDPSKTQDADVGILQLLTVLRSRIQRHIDVSGATAWYHDPVLDMDQLATQLGVLQASVAAETAAKEAGPIPWASGLVSYDSGLGTYELKGATGAHWGAAKHCVIGAQAGGIVRLDCTAPPAGYSLVAVHCTARGTVANKRMLLAEIYNGAGSPTGASALVTLADSSSGAVDNFSFYFTIFISKD